MPMLRSTPIFLIVFLVCCLCLANGARAQEEEQTLPIEVALLYDKLSGTVPDFDAYIAANDSLQKTADQFGQNALLEQQRRMLKAIYDGFSEATVLKSVKEIPITMPRPELRRIEMMPVDPFDPILFRLSDDKVYGVFIRNAADLATLKPPFEFEAIKGLDPTMMDKVAALTLRPIAADPEPFPLPDGTPVRVILADVVELRLYTLIDRRLMLQKRFKDWKPAPSKLGALYQSEGQ
jgi:hypothetical protein